MKIAQLDRKKTVGIRFFSKLLVEKWTLRSPVRYFRKNIYDYSNWTSIHFFLFHNAAFHLLLSQLYSLFCSEYNARLLECRLTIKINRNDFHALQIPLNKTYQPSRNPDITYLQQNKRMIISPLVTPLIQFISRQHRVI